MDVPVRIPAAIPTILVIAIANKIILQISLKPPTENNRRATGGTLQKSQAQWPDFNP